MNEYINNLILLGVGVRQEQLRKNKPKYYNNPKLLQSDLKEYEKLKKILNTLKTC